MGIRSAHWRRFEMREGEEGIGRRSQLGGSGDRGAQRQEAEGALRIGPEKKETQPISLGVKEEELDLWDGGRLKVLPDQGLELGKCCPSTNRRWPLSGDPGLPQALSTWKGLMHFSLFPHASPMSLGSRLVSTISC